MKTHYFIAALLFAVSLNAQNVLNGKTLEQKIPMQKHKVVLEKIGNTNNRKVTKSVTAPTLLDSTITKNSAGEFTDKAVYQYDSNGNNISQTLYSFDIWAASWSQSSQSVMTYNSHNLLTSEIIYLYDNTAQKMVPTNKETYTYNASNLVSTAISSTWNKALNQWSDYYKQVLTYNADGHVTLWMDYQYDGFDWQYYWQTIYEYDAAENLIKVQEYSYDTSTESWNTEMDYMQTFDAGNRVLTRVGTMFGLAVNEKYEYTFDSSNKLISSTMYSWNEGTSTWEPEEKEDTEYYSTGEMSENKIYTWDGTSFQLYASRNFDKNGNMIESVSYAFNSLTGSQPSSKYVYTFNSYNQTLTSINYDWNGSQWVMDNSTDFYYKKDIGTTVETNKNKFAIYPNPVKEQLFIITSENVKEVKIFGMSGNLVKSAEVTDNSLNVSTLPKGVYLIQIISGSGSKTGKFIKE